MAIQKPDAGEFADVGFLIPGTFAEGGRTNPAREPLARLSPI
jgi:hypothetical protein